MFTTAPPALLCSLRVTQQLPADPSPISRQSSINSPFTLMQSAKICCGSLLPSPVIRVPIFCPTWPGRPSLSVAIFDSQRRSHCHGSQILIADNSCCPRESVHSFSGPLHLRRKQKTKIWAAYAQPQPVKPSGNSCNAPGLLDWITGAHLEGDNCPVSGQASAVSLQHPRTEPLVSRKHPKSGQAEKWGLKPPQEGVTYCYQPPFSGSDPFLDRAPSPSSTPRSCSGAAELQVEQEPSSRGQKSQVSQSAITEIFISHSD